MDTSTNLTGGIVTTTTGTFVQIRQPPTSLYRETPFPYGYEILKAEDGEIILRILKGEYSKVVAEFKGRQLDEVIAFIETVIRDLRFFQDDAEVKAQRAAAAEEEEANKPLVKECDCWACSAMKKGAERR